MKSFSAIAHRWVFCAVALLCALYVWRLGADSIAGLFGVFWDDEGAYLLSAKNAVLFGQAHFFSGDRWMPELLSPLLHHVALLFMSPADPVFSIRLAVALHVLAGAGIIGWIAYKHFSSLEKAAGCVAVLLLNPVLFFYARIGLAEGLQFFLLALFLLTLFFLHHEKGVRVLWIAAASGALAAILLLSKLSAAPAAVVLSSVACLGLLRRQDHPRKWLAVALYVLAGLIVVGLYFTFGVGELFPDWWRLNIGEISRRTPLTPEMLFGVVRVKLSDIAYYLTLMPVFILYFCCLLSGAKKDDAYIRSLAAITALLLLIESFFGGEIRRNFFSLVMLSVTAGFTFPDYIRAGIPRLRPVTPLMLLATLMVALHLWGAGYLFYFSLTYSDTIYMVLTAVFLLLSLLMITASGPHYLRARQAMAAIVACCALLPILYESLLTPRTREAANRAIEEAVPEDAVISGAVAPWMQLGVKRRIVLSNCTWGNSRINYGNDIDTIPIAVDYFLSIHETHEEEHCAPHDFAPFANMGKTTLLFPCNPGGRSDTSEFWSFTKTVVLYGK